ncbi:redoxin domain-containing protein [Sneathiella chungangensis]|uniref:Redoxin domain-containing protein n=1 Tax=Sneathiella chungangensis TaxID=1418234 RepID=A0A845MI30_9PROT|nr:redoxin domain-containing protein [Sneathiella chungangensis]MZR23391.1 redoxin domain-containing protein [Sneathiella chungangensis]
MTSTKLAAGQQFPKITVPLVSGGTATLGADGTDQWQLVIIYRGKHCPICMRYLGQLESLKADFEAAGVAVTAVSGDGAEKAKAVAAEHNLTFPVGYNLTIPQMAELGLYVSDPRSPKETDQPFPEPGLFVLRPDNAIQIIDISNAPFARPDLSSILRGIKFIRENDYPVRGTHSV